MHEMYEAALAIRKYDRGERVSSFKGDFSTEKLREEWVKDND